MFGFLLVFVFLNVFKSISSALDPTIVERARFYDPPFTAQAGCGDVTSIYKNLVKNTKT